MKEKGEVAKRLPWIRRTEIRLLDGEVYSFAEVPAGHGIAAKALRAMARDAVDGAGLLLAMREAIVWSLSLDQGEEEAERLLAEGVCPVVLTLTEEEEATDQEGEIAREVLGAVGLFGFRRPRAVEATPGGPAGAGVGADAG